MQESTKIIEPILCLRRVALAQTKRIIQDKVPSAIPFIDSLLGESWLFSAKIARRAGVLDRFLLKFPTNRKSFRFINKLIRTY